MHVLLTDERGITAIVPIIPVARMEISYCCTLLALERSRLELGKARRVSTYNLYHTAPKQAHLKYLSNILWEAFCSMNHRIPNIYTQGNLLNTMRTHTSQWQYGSCCCHLHDRKFIQFTSKREWHFVCKFLY